ncbi:MAG: lysine--tRNA ligase [Nitrososphaerales archaeon]|nr:lysine--tRNA ligase [Nitrososphaerales archaeon]
MVIGRGTWLDKVAFKIVEREKSLGRSLSNIRVESGLGASGIHHVGSLSDAVRAYGVKMALENLGYRSELIAFSDDMDGLRKVPSGMPEWLNEYLARPVCTIPDPFGCHRSYGAHMSSMLLDSLDRLNIKYNFQSGAEAYKSGILNKSILLILENSQTIGKKIAEMVGQRKFEEVLPYFPICENCGRIYLAEAYQYIKEEQKVLYRCCGARIGNRWVDGCGYEGEVDVTKGKGKLSWKVEFAARWSALDIRFEAYGKDIADSVRVNDWVADEILNYPHPFHIRYELFLDKSGRKISKSLGNVFTPQTWLRYGTPQSLMLLMFKRIAGTRNLAVEDILNYMDEYDALEDVYFGRLKIDNPAKLRQLKGLYEYVNHLNPPSKPQIHVPQRLLIQLASFAPPENRVEYVIQRLVKYGIIKQATNELNERIKLAINWVEDFKSIEPIKLTLSEKEANSIKELIEFLSKETNPEKIQSEIFQIARRNGIDPPEFFKLLYKAILGSDRGPRLGPYIVDIGIPRVLELLKRQI